MGRQSYGKGVTSDDGMVYFDQVTGWDGKHSSYASWNFTDAVIAGNGTYTVSVDGLDFSKFDDFFRIRISLIFFL